MVRISYRIGIVDDDSTKITQLITNLKLCCRDEYGNAVKPKYSNFYFEPIEFDLQPNEDDMLHTIIDSNLDAIIIDYKLSSQQNIAYSGVSLAKQLAEQRYNFPNFILTTYQDDLFIHELFDAYLVFDFARYIGEDLERLELNSKIIEQINKYHTEKLEWEKELLDLIPDAGSSAVIDERIIALDSQLERMVNGKSTLSDKLKLELTADRVQLIIDKIDKIIESE